MYGRFVNANGPYGEPPLPVGTYACQAQKLPPALKPSGKVPVGETTTYCALRFADGVTLLKCAAAVTASAPIWPWLACAGAAADASTHTPA